MLLGTKHTIETKRKIAKAHTKAESDKAITYRNGYRYLYKPKHPNADCDGRVGEHVLIMCDYLGRALKKGEHVHHKNKDRLDNMIENLELHTASTHMQTHRLEYKQSVVDRICGLCKTDKTTMNSKYDRKGIKYIHPDWRHIPSLYGDMWLCRTCFNREKYYKIKKW